MRLSLALSILALPACFDVKTGDDTGSAPPDKADQAPPDRTESGDAGDVESGNQVGDADEGASATIEWDTTTTTTWDTGTLYVLNMSDYDVCWVYADTCDGSYMSDDLLGSDYLPYGSYLAVSDMPDTCWALYAYDCDDRASWYTTVQLDGDFTWILTGTDDTTTGGTDTGYYTTF